MPASMAGALARFAAPIEAVHNLNVIAQFSATSANDRMSAKCTFSPTSRLEKIAPVLLLLRTAIRPGFS